MIALLDDAVNDEAKLLAKTESDETGEWLPVRADAVEPGDDRGAHDST